MDRPKNPKITTERVDRALAILAVHIQRHVAEHGSSPFLCLFERLELEREQVHHNDQIMHRALALLDQSATRSSHSCLNSSDDPSP